MKEVLARGGKVILITDHLESMKLMIKIFRP